MASTCHDKSNIIFQFNLEKDILKTYWNIFQIKLNHRYKQKILVKII